MARFSSKRTYTDKLTGEVVNTKTTTTKNRYGSKTITSVNGHENITVRKNGTAFTRGLGYTGQVLSVVLMALLFIAVFGYISGNNNNITFYGFLETLANMESVPEWSWLVDIQNFNFGDIPVLSTIADIFRDLFVTLLFIARSVWQILLFIFNLLRNFSLI